jgi:hypothetical protein
MRFLLFVVLLALSTQLFAQNVFQLKIPTWEEFAEGIYKNYAEAHKYACDSSELFSFDQLELDDFALYGPLLDENDQPVAEGEMSGYQIEYMRRKIYDRITKKIVKRVINKSNQLQTLSFESNQSNVIELKVKHRKEDVDPHSMFFFIRIDYDCKQSITWTYEVLKEGKLIGQVDIIYSGLEYDFSEGVNVFSSNDLKDVLAENGIQF